MATEPLGKSQDLGLLREFSPRSGLSPPKNRLWVWAGQVLGELNGPCSSWPGVSVAATLFHVE